MQQVSETELERRARQRASAPSRTGQRLIFLQQLKELKGIPYSRPHLHRLIKAGQFPRPIKLGLNRNAWIEEEIDAYIEGRIAARDAGQGGA